jgi:Zn-dependent M32 family carboxypeptidase
MAKVKGKTKGKVKKETVGISREVWEWARANPRYESLMEELEDLEDLRREKAKKEKGTPLEEVLKEYETTHHVQLDR